MEKNSPLSKILSPSSCVFVGPSNKPTSMGATLLCSCLLGGYKGEVFVVHPSEKEVFGIKVYKSILDLPKVPDLAVIVVPREVCIKVIEECGEKGIKHAIVVSGGFKETDEVGAHFEEKLNEVAKKYGIRFIGPNCIGVCNPLISFNTTPFDYVHIPGNIGVASQSGTYLCQMFSYFARFGMAISRGISTGNEANIDICDCLEYMEEEDEVKACALYIEGIKRGDRFVEVAKRVSSKKPIVALYVGGTEAGKRSGLSHTGAIAGPSELYDGVFKQTGVIKVETIDELYGWSWALSTQPLPKSKRVAIVTNSGGPATSMADAAEKAGLSVPIFSNELQERIRRMIPPTGSSKNPVDTTFSLDFETLLNKVPELVLSSDEVDGLLLFFVPGIVEYNERARIFEKLMRIPFQRLKAFLINLGERLCEIHKRYNKPIICASFYGRESDLVSYLQDHGIPVYSTPEKAAKAMGVLYKYKEVKDRLCERVSR